MRIEVVPIGQPKNTVGQEIAGLEGYLAERLTGPRDISFAWKITGPRGQTWKLMRNRVHPYMLFPVPENFVKGQSIIRGHKWFSDRSGNLEAL